jgi:PTS system N-acetylglucosamine-specific IIC component
VHGDLTRFFAGDPHAGGFMTGFFPIMMFALPAACLAMIRTARPERRKEIAGILGAAALTSFLTGVTEPIEFAFIFVAPSLFVVHAILTGTAMILTNALGIHEGFTFSGGFTDWALNFLTNYASKPWLIIPVGLVYAVIYYFVFRFMILKFNLRTPGREQVDVLSPDGDDASLALAMIHENGGLPSQRAVTVDDGSDAKASPGSEGDGSGEGAKTQA